MKVEIINDCAHVCETLIKYLPEGIDAKHLKRSRGFLDKTVKLAYNIAKSKADVYHANYLLQDCYLANIMNKHPLIGHAHGSDLRDGLNSFRWGRMVKSNLKKCDVILVSQPTLLETALEYNANSRYFPIPFDPKIFYPKETKRNDTENKSKTKTIFIASSHNSGTKGTDNLLWSLFKLKRQFPFRIKTFNHGKDLDKFKELARFLKMESTIDYIDNVRHEYMAELYRSSDLVLGSWGIGQLDTVAIEAMACGRPVIQSINKRYFPSSCPLERLSSFVEVADLIQTLLFDEKAIKHRIYEQNQYVQEYHKGSDLAVKLADIYRFTGGESS